MVVYRYYAISYKGLEYSQILVYLGGLGTNSPWRQIYTPKKTTKKETVEGRPDLEGSQGTLVC